MFDPRSYHDACSELHASEEKIEEIIAMTTNHETKRNRRHPLRMTAVIAATLALLTIGASAANPEMLRSFTLQIASVLNVGELRQDMTTEEGVTLTTLEIPEAQVEDRDGQSILVVMDEEINITSALEEEGRYEYRFEDEGAQLTVLVEGTPEDWTMTTSAGIPGEEPMISVVTTKEEQTHNTSLGPDYVMETPPALEEGGGASGEAAAATVVDGTEAEPTTTPD